MKALQRTLAMVAFLFLVAQTLRHAYMVWLEPRGSALDKYDQPAKGQIAGAGSLDELVQRYDTVRKQVELEKEKHGKSEGQQVSATGQEIVTAWAPDNQKEPFKSEQMLREAIVEWESRWKEIRELRFYWLLGLVLLVSGMGLYIRKNRWFGLGLLIAAFSEFIYWTSPTFIGATREFDRLLMNKLGLSAVSLVLLVGTIGVLGIFSDNRDHSGH